MKIYINIFWLAIVLFFTGACTRENELGNINANKDIVFRVSDETRASVVTTSTLVSNGFYVNCATGSTGSESEVWSNAAYTYDSGDAVFKTASGKVWPTSNQNYIFFGSNASMTFTASGPTVSANANTDVICAYLASPSFKEVNALTFKHVFARIGNVTVTAVDGFTISGLSVMITPNVSGTYNVQSGASTSDATGWSGLSAGSAVNLSNSTVGTKANNVWLVPGDYTLTIGWTATKYGVSYTYSGRTMDVSLLSNVVNSISLSVGGAGDVISCTASVNAWNAATLAMGDYDPMEGVDMGYRDGSGNIVLYGSRNIGAVYDYDYGDYYAWGETTKRYTGFSGSSVQGAYFWWDNCPYHTGTNENTGWTKYIPTSQTSVWSGSGSPDGKTQLDPEDDAAAAQLGCGWRMMNFEEVMFLVYTCHWTHVSNYKGTGSPGYVVTGTNGNTIFFPFSGWVSETSREGVGYSAYIWVGSKGETSTHDAHMIFCYWFDDSDNGVSVHGNTRLCGRVVRPVKTVPVS